MDREWVKGESSFGSLSGNRISDTSGDPGSCRGGIDTSASSFPALAYSACSPAFDSSEHFRGWVLHKMDFKHIQPLSRRAIVHGVAMCVLGHIFQSFPPLTVLAAEFVFHFIPSFFKVR